MLAATGMVLSMNTSYAPATIPDNVYELPMDRDDMRFDHDATSLKHPLVAERPKFGNFIFPICVSLKGFERVVNGGL